MNPLSQRSHCTQFMLDFMANERKQDSNAFQDYHRREEDYDLSFSESWLMHVNSDVIDNADQLFELLVKIQKTAMQHIERVGVTGQGEKYRTGIYVGNSYSVSKGLVSDLEGIRELISQIWFEGKDVRVTVYSEKRLSGFHDIYYLQKSGFFHRNNRLRIDTEVFANDHSSQSFEQIFNKVREFYEVGLLKDGYSPLRIQSTIDQVRVKKEKALEFFNQYLKAIRDTQTQEEKIIEICRLSREIEQLHLFHDGNGRSVFILANALACWNGLNPFYPRNMCVFDANSLDTMVREVVEGSARFASLFGSHAQLNRDLMDYKNRVRELQALIKDKFSRFSLIMQSVKERNFNLLLRQSAADKNTIELLEFLIQNHSTLNIDMQSRGEKSGTAMDIAVRNANMDAIKLLEEHPK